MQPDHSKITDARVNRWLFWAVLLTPAFVTFLLAAVGTRSDATMAVPVVGSVISGILGAMLRPAARDRSAGYRIAHSLFSGLAYVGLSLTLCALGCNCGGRH